MLARYRVFYFLFFLLSALLFTQNARSASSSQSFTAKQGVLDLRHYDFDKANVILLTGDWEFYWQEFKNSHEVDDLPPDEKKYLDVITPWKGKTPSGQIFTPQGYATYSLKILLPPERVGKPLSLRIGRLLTAYRFYVDEDLLAQVGQAGSSKESSSPGSKIVSKTFFPQSSQIRLTLHVSNFFYPKGGFRNITFRLGKPEAVHKQNAILLVTDLVLLGIFAIMFLHHLALLFFMPNKGVYFTFSFILLMFFLRVLTRGEMFIHTIFPQISFLWQIRLEYLSFYVAVPFFYYFLYYTIQTGFSRYLLIFYTIVGGIFSLAVLFTDTLFFTRTLLYFQLFSVLILITIVYGMLYSLYHKKT